MLQEFFLLFPHNGARDTLAQFLTTNALSSTWIFAAAFYAYWRIEDARTRWRRARLLETFVAFSLAMLVTLAVRPWIAWPAPSLISPFQQLYPDYFWHEGNPNSFPSHSTLVYLIVAAGIWPFKRWLSALLTLLVLLVISLPRIYVGGHYPVDVIAAILLAGIAVWAAHAICSQVRVSTLLAQIVSKGLLLEIFLFLWLFELAEGFRSSYFIATKLAEAVRSIWH